MKDTNRERQKRYREKMYKAGFKHIFLWVNRKEGKKTEKMRQGDFLQKFKKLTAGWSSNNLSKWYKLILKITEARKEVIKLRESE